MPVGSWWRQLSSYTYHQVTLWFLQLDHLEFDIVR